MMNKIFPALGELPRKNNDIVIIIIITNKT